MQVLFCRILTGGDLQAFTVEECLQLYSTQTLRLRKAAELLVPVESVVLEAETSDLGHQLYLGLQVQTMAEWRTFDR